MKMLNVYTCTNFKGHNRIGTAAIITAENPEQAACLLEEKLAEIGLPQGIKPSQMKPAITITPHCEILCNGDY